MAVVPPSSQAASDVTSVFARTGAVVAASGDYTASQVGASGSDGWTAAADTLVYASATTFTIAGADRTVLYSKGTRIKLTNTTLKYFVVVASAFSTDTTVTVTGGSDYALANAVITSPSYSYAANPQGYPGWFVWAPAPTGYTGAVTVAFARFSVLGTICTFELQFTGTSNATTLTFTLPVTVPRVNGLIQPAFGRDANAALPSPALLNNSGADTTCQAYKNYLLGVWTASLSKDIIAFASYEI